MPNTAPERIDVADGKYTVINDNGRLSALRHGEPWQDLAGNNLVYWLAVELRDARATNQELLEALKASAHGLHPADDNGPCLCSQCQFVQLRNAAIAKATQQPPMRAGEVAREGSLLAALHRILNHTKYVEDGDSAMPALDTIADEVRGQLDPHMRAAAGEGGEK